MKVTTSVSVMVRPRETPVLVPTSSSSKYPLICSCTSSAPLPDGRSLLHPGLRPFRSVLALVDPDEVLIGRVPGRGLPGIGRRPDHLHGGLDRQRRRGD